MKAIFTVKYVFEDEELKKIAEEKGIDLSENNEDREDELYDALNDITFNYTANECSTDTYEEFDFINGNQ